MELSNSLKQRFIKDYNLPIQVFDKEYFDYYLDLYEESFGTRTKMDRLIYLINSRFNGNCQLFLDEYAKVRDSIICTIENSESYKSFNAFDMSKYKIPNLEISSTNIYNENNDGKYFISIDLKKANFQALNYHDKNILLNSDTYDEFIGHFTSLEYVKESKYTRQVIFGKWNPKRTTTIEKYMMYQVLSSPNPSINEWFKLGKVVSFAVDEIVIEILKENIHEFAIVNLKELQEIVQDFHRFNVDVEFFQLKKHEFRTVGNDNKMVCYTKEFIHPKKEDELMGVPNFYYAQVYKLLNGFELRETDKIFYHNNQVAQFIHYLQKVD
jgi:hypothetical protein